jgi:hypothetical protein
MVKVKKTPIFILLLICLAFFLRARYLSTDLLFHRDQGLHSLSIWNIWHEKKLSLLGHPSDVDGLIHAPIYYWLMLPVYVLSGGNPVAASLFQIIMEVLSLPFLYLAIKKLFNQRTALLTLLIYSISYGGIGLSRWLVNVTPILPLTNLLLYFLACRHKKGSKPYSIFITSLVVGIITQLNAAVGVFLLPLLFWFHRSRLNIKTLCLIMAGFLLPALPLLIFELRHSFVVTKAILSFSGQGTGLSLTVFTTNLKVLLVEINKIVSYPHTYISSFLFIFGLLKIRKLKQSKFIYAFLLIPLLGLSLFQRGAIGFFLVSLMPLALAVSVYGLQSITKLATYPLLVLVLGLNLVQLPNVYKPNNALTPIGNANIITLQDRKNIIDFMYQKANGEPFSVWFYTIPYFQEEVWDYMFKYYANPKYGYLPEKTSGFSLNDLKTSKHFFSVYEKDEDQPTKLESWHQETVKNFGDSTSSYTSGGLHASLHTWSSVNKLK